jgi:murein DD-endopeptidase MepM/ murein hydrolase activator NlpD
MDNRPFRTLRLQAVGSRMIGDDVMALQQAINGHLERHASLHEGADRLAEDGEYGPATRAAYRWVGWYVTGFLRRTVQVGASPAAQRLIRDPSRLDDAQLRRARERQRDLSTDGGQPPKPGYPLGRIGTLIGTPGVGTHSWHVAPNNWQSDRAVDLGVPKGTGVFAVVDGVIGPQFGPLSSTEPRFAGIRLYVNGGGNSWYYAHLDSTADGIAPGVAVKQGQLLGRSGVANGVPHLHLACENGDPRSIL